MIYIHIGLQKTGTTSLQFILNEHKLLKFPLDPVKNIKTKKINFIVLEIKNFFINAKEIILKEFILKILQIKILLFHVKTFQILKII